MPVGRLVDRTPQVPRSRLVADLRPPPRFTGVRFDTYRPNPGEPTQAAALARMRAFAAAVAQPPPRRTWWRRAAPPAAGGIYLDGGFGVGKTHLLASLWHAVPAPAAYATFGEVTSLVGALGFRDAVEALSGMRLLCIDEFELDDPGDTMLVSTLLSRLTERGTYLAATSNTLPDRLGEGRFAAADFRREIAGLADRFDTVRVDGPDYRHRGLPAAPPPLEEQALRARADAVPGATLDDFSALVEHLAGVHPVRYGALLDGVTAVHLSQLCSLSDQAAALRLVVFADRLYDRNLPIAVSGTALDELFPAELLRGGYRKKYLRAVSRLTALARQDAPGR